MRAARAAAALLEPLLPEEGTVLVAGLGNPAMTPDALGPLTLEHLLITRHLGEVLPDFRPVAALAGGVLGTTGLEAAEWVRGVTERLEPAAVVVVDALASRGLDVDARVYTVEAAAEQIIAKVAGKGVAK